LPGTAAHSPAPVQETEAIVGGSQKVDGANASKNSGNRRIESGRTAGTRETKGATVARRDVVPPPLTSTWPSSASQQTPVPPPPGASEPSAPRPEERVVQEPPRPAEPPRPTFEELVISPNSAIGLQMEHLVSSDTAKVEDRVDARVTRDVRVGDRVAVPAGTRAIGSVTQVERGGKFKERALLAIRFHTLVLADGTRLPVSTETITRIGEAPGNGSAAKIGGGAVGGAIIGAILGGAKGAAIGATAGAGGGAAAVAASDRSSVVFQPGAAVTARITSPVTVTVER
jgi:hypothetical protein